MSGDRWAGLRASAESALGRPRRIAIGSAEDVLALLDEIDLLVAAVADVGAERDQAVALLRRVDTQFAPASLDRDIRSFLALSDEENP